MTDGQNTPGNDRVIAISTGIILRAAGIILICVFLYLLRDVVAMFLGGLFLAALIDPFADYFERYRIPRGLAVLIVYVIGIGVLSLAGYFIIPPMLEELRNFLSVFSPALSEATGVTLNLRAVLNGELTVGVESLFSTIRGSGFSAAVPQIIDIGSAALDVIVAIVLILILAFYFVVEKGALVQAVSFITPKEYHAVAIDVALKVRERLGAWLRGEIVLMFSIFFLTYIALTILGIPYALLLALIAGLLEIIPFIGPILSGVPATILALSVSFWHALMTVAVYLIIQAVEGNFLVPKVMQRATGLNPLVSLLVVLIGWRLGGIVGAILSIPLANAAAVFLNEAFRKHQTS